MNESAQLTAARAKLDGLMLERAALLAEIERVAAELAEAIAEVVDAEGFDTLVRDFVAAGPIAE